LYKKGQIFMTKQVEKLLELKELRTSFRIEGEFYAAVDGVNLTIHKDEVSAIVGESGCGKSAMALSLVRLHNSNYTRIAGQILFHERDILQMEANELNHTRGGGIGMIFQDPLSALNPLHRIGTQIEEVLVYHTDMNANQRRERAIELLTQVGMTNPKLTYTQFPHELLEVCANVQ
jgi:peptide/nickel transport system ATP-binding protein